MYFLRGEPTEQQKIILLGEKRLEMIVYKLGFTGVTAS